MPAWFSWPSSVAAERRTRRRAELGSADDVQFAGARVRARILTAGTHGTLSGLVRVSAVHMRCLIPPPNRAQDGVCAKVLVADHVKTAQPDIFDALWSPCNAHANVRQIVSPV